jgi:outer membrane protein assembly factor BamC
MSLATTARVLPLTFALLALAGCQGFSMENVLSSKIDYRSATRSAALEVPPDLNTPVYDDRYLPKDGAPGSATFSGYERGRGGAAKAQSTLLPAVEKVSMERAGTQRWLVVQMPPEKVWSAAHDFWSNLGFAIAIERPELGIMETDWAENRAMIPDDLLRRSVGKVLDFLWATSERDKFRTRLEPGAAPGTTEIYISHRGMREVPKSSGPTGAEGWVWAARPSDPELETEMLRRLMLRIGLPEQQAQTQVAVAKSPLVEQARLSKSANGSPTLSIEDSFDRAWRRVGLALDRIGFTVVDRDRSKGIYYVRYVDPDSKENKKEEGFLSKLMFWKGEDPKDKEEQYRIAVVESAGRSVLSIMDRNGAPDTTPTGERIFALLHGQLK